MAMWSAKALPLRGGLLPFGVVRKFQNQDVFVDSGAIAGCTQVLSEIRGFTSLILAVADEQFVLRDIGKLDQVGQERPDRDRHATLKILCVSLT